MNRNDISRIIEETILEMLEDDDENLVSLMMEHEKRYGERSKSKQQFLTETIDTLKDKLGILTEDGNVDENDPLLVEQKKMAGLVSFLEDNVD